MAQDKDQEERRELRDAAQKKAIRTALDGLIRAHGIAAVRRVCNNYFKTLRVRAKLEREVAQREKELAMLRAKMGG